MCFDTFLSHLNANNILLSNMIIQYLQSLTILASENAFLSENGPTKINRSSVHIRLWVQEYELMDIVGDRGNRIHESCIQIRVALLSPQLLCPQLMRTRVRSLGTDTQLSRLRAVTNISMGSRSPVYEHSCILYKVH
jgi:hypothetical protein